MNHSIKTLVIATAFFASLAIASSVSAADVAQIKVSTTNSNFLSSVSVNPGATVYFQIFYNSASTATTFTVDFPSNLSFADASTWTFAAANTKVITFSATVASGADFVGTDHTLEVSFTTDGVPVSSTTATITVGPIVTGITPSVGNNLFAVPITQISGHGLTSTTVVVLSSNGSDTNHTFDISGATITNTSISGPSIRVPVSFAPGSYWVLATAGGLTTAANSAESAQYTVDMTPPTASISYIQNSASITSVKAGEVTITVTFDEPIQATPKIAIDQQGTTDIAATNLSGSGATWTYAYTVHADDASLYVDGAATITISTALDSVGNAFVGPASNNTFTIDTVAPTPAITNLSASADGPNSIRLSWSSDYNEADFSTYKIYHRTTTGVTSTSGTLVSKNTSGYSALGATATANVTVLDLVGDTRHYFVAYICDAAENCSALSNETFSKPTGGAVAPVSGGGGGSSGPALTYQTYNPQTGELTIGEEVSAPSPEEQAGDEGQILGSSIGAYPNGTLLKVPNAPAVWYIAGGQKHVVRSAAIFESRFNWNDIITLPSSLQLALYEQGSHVKFAAGTLVKIIGEPAVYRVSAEGGISPVVSGEIFLGRGWSFNDVIEVEAAELVDYTRLVAIVDTQTLYDGELVKLAINPAVYYVEEATFRLIPSLDIFHENAFKFRNVRTISTAAFGRLEFGIVYTYPDGTLVKGASSAVYIISDGAKRPILSTLDFEALLYDWNKIRYVPETILAAIPSASVVRLVSEDVNLAGE